MGELVAMDTVGELPLGGVFRNLDKIEPAMDADSAVPDAPPQEFANGVSNEWHSVKLNTLGFKVLRRKAPRII